MSAEAVDRTLLVDILARMACVLLDRQENMLLSSPQIQTHFPSKCAPELTQPQAGGGR